MVALSFIFLSDMKGDYMNKTYRITLAYTRNYRIEAFEDGKLVINVILDDYNIEGASKILDYLGYRLTKREY